MAFNKEIEKLREVCQGVHSDDPAAQIVRKVSIFITYFVIKIRITANHVSIVNIFVGLLSGVLAYWGNIFVAICFFWLNTVLDGVDGEVARYNKSSSLTGLYADRINSIFIYPAFFGGIGVSIYEGDYRVLLLGCFVGAGFVMLRMLKTSIDTTVIDGFIMTNKAFMDNKVSMDNKETYVHPSEMIRNKNNIMYYLVDFILIRQPGMAVFISVIYGLGLITNLHASLYYMLMMYAALLISAMAVGTHKIFKDNVVEQQYYYVLTKIKDLEGN